MTREARFTEQMGYDLYDHLRDAGNDAGPPPRGGDASRSGKPHTIVVALLQDIESGDAGLAARLTRLETNQRQIIDVQGNIPPATVPTFRLSYTVDGETEQTDLISADATPDEVRLAIEDLPFFNPGDIRVELGTHRRPQIFNEEVFDTYILRRWIIEFTGRFEDENIDLFVPTIAAGSSLAFTVSHTTVLADTGATEFVRCVIPVGVPTPLRRGAIGVASWGGNEFGYVLHAVEPRSLQEIADPGAY